MSERPITADGTRWGSPEWYDARWASVPEQTRERIIEHLRANAEPGALDEIRGLIEQHGRHAWTHAGPGHHGFGTNVRNLLRAVVKDDHLPPAPYPKGKAYSNWDDYYVQALEAAASPQVGSDG